MNQDSLGIRETRNLIGTVILVGTILLAVARFAPPLISEEHHFPGFDLVMELIRDVGIAFVVAAVVGATFELGARRRFVEAMMADSIHAFMGDRIGPDIWEDVSNEILDRKAIRKNFELELRLFKGPTRGLPDNVMVLWSKGEYDLYSKEKGKRKGKRDEVEVAHFLVRPHEYGDLPRFIKAEVGDEHFPPDNDEKGVFDDERKEFKHKVMVNGRDGDPVHVALEREDLVYLPGSFSLYMYEMTKGFRLKATHIPVDVEVAVRILPHISAHQRENNLLYESEYFHLEELKYILFLPGQAIEFQLKKRG